MSRQDKRRLAWMGLVLNIDPCHVEPEAMTKISMTLATKSQKKLFSQLVWGCTSRARKVRPDGVTVLSIYSEADYVFRYDCWARFSNGSKLAYHLTNLGILSDKGGF